MRGLLTVGAIVTVAAIARTQQPAVDDARIAKLVAALGVEKVVLRDQVCALLTKIGGPAVPHLVRAMPKIGDEDISLAEQNAVCVLGRIGEPAAIVVPRLVRLIPHDNTAFERAVILALGQIAPHATRHAAEIRTVMLDVVANDPVGVAAGNARHLFVTVGAAQPTAMRTYSRTLLAADAPSEALAVALRHDNPYVRELAIELLSRRKTVTDEVIVALGKVMHEVHPHEIPIIDENTGDPVAGEVAAMSIDMDRRLHHAAARAMFALAPDDPRSVPAHVYLLERPGPETRRRAALALGRIGAVARPAVETLTRLLDSEIVEVRREIATALGMIGIATPEVTAALERARESDDVQLSKRAAAALRRLQR